ncbi:MAG: hypothetical protein ABSA90_05680 [Xanthobacteraceae bacterium]|jgi:hypothetical protein
MANWARIAFWVSVVGGIIGILGTVFGIWAFYQNKEVKVLTFQRYTRTVYSDPEYFSASFHVKNINKEDTSWFSETTIVIWNSGTVTYRDADVRVPIKIDMGKVGYLLAIKIAETKSSVPDNFTVVDFNPTEPTPQTAVIAFKLFDPGMAVKIALLHQGDARHDIER